MLAHAAKKLGFRQSVFFGSTLRQSLSTGRPQSQIDELVQMRVKERDNWKVNGSVEGSMPPLGEIFNAIRESRRLQKPSQAELDRDFPVRALDWQLLQSFDSEGSQIQITWLGHASLLVQLPGGFTIVTDPVFSERASFTQWLGPKRYRRPPCSVSEICENLDVDAVLISHNHYDHLDFNTVKQFSDESPETEFVVPLGLKAWFRSYVSDTAPIHEVDWHESAEIGGSIITAVPMRHWSNRIGDRDKSLWCGYSVETSTKRFLFPGDTAWYDKLEEIGNRYGPFDLAAIPIGAYAPRSFMKYVHINVEEAVRMKDAVKAAFAVPIHYGTFSLTSEPVLEPPQKLTLHMKEREDASSFEPWLNGETKVF
jgi:L-ascorbate metabolism protein UlaG (beta-lactamase superfamily)